VVTEFPYSEEASECQGKCCLERNIVVIGWREVAKKAEKRWVGQRRSCLALRFLVVLFDPMDGWF